MTKAKVKRAKAAAKRKGPSKASMPAKRKQRALARKARQIAGASDGPLSIGCPSCRARKGAPCFAYNGDAMGQVHSARSAKWRAAAAPAPKAEVGRPVIARPPDGRIDPKRVKIGERHRKDFGDLAALARSIDERGGLLQPIALTPKFELIAGERRLRAWPLTRFAAEPIPYHVTDVDSIVAGEWTENAERKDFTKSEAVAMHRSLEAVLRNIAAAAPSTTGKRGRPATGRASDKAAALTGVSRRTLEKAAQVVEAAEADQEAYGDLVEEMDRTDNVNVAAKKLAVRKQRQALADAPAPMPMNAKACATWLVDFPWAGELDDDQGKLDAADRTFRPYPEMSIKTCCAFARDEIKPNLPEQVSLWLAVTNFVLTRGYHLHVIEAMGLKPEHACTMLTWGKDKLGRGKVLRDRTEHFILLRRGHPLIDVFGEDPPSTLLMAPRRENSRKPDELFRLIERTTPAKRYASIFSRGGEGADWDGHGDQVGKFAPAIARAAEAELTVEAKGETPAGCSVCEACAGADHDPACPQYVPPLLVPPAAAPFDAEAERQALAAIDAGGRPARDDAPLILAKRGLVHAGKETLRLTDLGRDRLAALNARRAEAPAVPPQQIDLEEAIAERDQQAADNAGLLPAFLMRGEVR